jgi:hypothetical protein
MPTIFTSPEFGTNHLELRCEGDEVAIYATETGLNKLIEFCRELLDDRQIGHIHLEDYDVLTAKSLRGSIAIVERPSKT